MLDNSVFPKGFLWGAATASYQVEGGIENVDWAQGARDGKLPPCGIATDHYHKFEADFDIAKSLGHNAHRFSIEWARIEPEEGKFDEKEIEHYREVIRALKARGLEPFVTLWHFTLPLWFSNQGGFQNAKAPEQFARYCEYVILKLGNEATYWMTINEPLVWASGGYLRGHWPPFKKNFFVFHSIHNALILAHKKAYVEMKKHNPLIHIGVAKHNIFFDSNFMPWNLIARAAATWYWNFRFLNGISKHQDFIGLNHYFYKRFGGNGNLPKSDMGWDIYPKALYGCLMQLKKYRKPIYITENGIADEKDTQRSEFIPNYIREVKRAISNGAPVKGYFYWSLLDNFEWSFGFTRRFGLVEINYDNLERKIRPSSLIYKKIIESNVL